MANVAQLVRASGCGSEGRGFDPLHSPQIEKYEFLRVGTLFYLLYTTMSVRNIQSFKDKRQVGCTPRATHPDKRIRLFIWRNAPYLWATCTCRVSRSRNCISSCGSRFSIT